MTLDQAKQKAYDMGKQAELNGIRSPLLDSEFMKFLDHIRPAYHTIIIRSWYEYSREVVQRYHASLRHW